MSSGKIVQIIGAVVDVEFPRDAMPKIYDALNVEESGLTLEVQQQLGDGIVRTIAMGSTEGLKRGLKAENTGKAISVPVGTQTLGRIMDVLGRPIDEQGEIGEEERWAIHRKAPGYADQSASADLLETGALLDATVAQNEAQRREMWGRREAAAELLSPVLIVIGHPDEQGFPLVDQSARGQG